MAENTEKEFDIDRMSDDEFMAHLEEPQEDSDEIDDETAFLIDSSAAEVRVAAAAYCDEIGVSDRAIYNSINASVTSEEIEGLKNSKIDSSIVLAFNATDPTVKGKMDVLETGAGLVEKGLLKIAEECGITRPIIDVAAMPLGVGAGASIRSVITVKATLGLPAGGGFHNTASAWDWMKKFKKQYREAYPPTDIGTNLIAQILGADFLLYGPIENARLVFPAVAMVDIMLAENAQELGLKVLEESHPINKLI